MKEAVSADEEAGGRGNEEEERERKGYYVQSL